MRIMLRIFQSVTARFALIIVVMAFLTAITLYGKESDSVIQMYANMGSLGHSLSEEQAAHYRQAAFWNFLFFCMPLIPLFICFGRKYAQVVIAASSLVVLMLALSVSPGGDYKGCEGCFMPFFFSGASTIILSIIAVLWVSGALIFRFLTRNSME
jgi:hypothetical protein